MKARFAKVAIPPLETLYTYSLPDSQNSQAIEVGSRVTVPLGKRFAYGYVVELSESADVSGINIKSISREERIIKAFAEGDLNFFSEVAEYYNEPLAKIIELGIPSIPPKRNAKILHIATLPSNHEKSLKGSAQKAIFEFISSLPEQKISTSILVQHFPLYQAPVRALIKKGLLVLNKVEIIDQHLDHSPPPQWAKTNITLTAEQELAKEKVLNAYREKRFESFLLFGVAGSGKTEVYIEIAKEIIKDGKAVLILVPEIALTPQMIDRLKARFGKEIATLHSALTTRARWDAWRALLEGREQIAIGARSAIFAPIPNLGCIFIDEEHDQSYKQSDGIRYNARDLGVLRAKINNCPIVLGSATPSLESIQNARLGKYLPLKLDKRYSSSEENQTLIVDLCQIKPWDMPTKNISPQLLEALSETIKAGKKAFILFNRRGFASFMQCLSCGHVIKCPDCSVTLTYHKTTNSLLCHYCDYRYTPPTNCPECSRLDQSVNLKKEKRVGKMIERGAGTEKIYEELAKLFPTVEIIRLDRDTANQMENYRRALERMRIPGAGILVGTQIIAKGHDFPAVNLVGVIDADIGLHLPDFRAAERAFQLLTQVAGRAGRGKEAGKVIFQTRLPNHPSLIFASKKDFSSFATKELEYRKQLAYPPFSKLLRIIISGEDIKSVALEAKRLKEFTTLIASQHKLDLKILGPSLAPIEKVKKKWRWHILIKSSLTTTLLSLISTLKTAAKKKSKKIVVAYDLDPQEML
ncbi:MAG TPA: primosomal protein N' [Oligoflexia bacterium]|nr:primosomal protein N' [Oligoflexia bacterium]HMP27421.1 primosomal protein N' [Oligoflexia bacterium]